MPVNWGTIFRVETNGGGLTLSHNLDPSVGEGQSPRNGLLLSDGTLYGTTYSGTLFEMNPDGTGFATLLCLPCIRTNSSLLAVVSTLAQSGSSLYGISSDWYGGAQDIFRIGLDGGGYTNICHFDGYHQPPLTLLASGDRLYGFAGETLFRVNTDGTGFTELHKFAGDWGSGLALAGTTLYGTTATNGILFRISTDGSAFETLYTFTGGADGRIPVGTLVVTNGVIYGTTFAGGGSDTGTVFSFALANLSPLLEIKRSDTKAVLSWPTNYAGYVLESTASLCLPAATWEKLPTTAITVGGEYKAFIDLVDPQRFFRLRR